MLDAIYSQAKRISKGDPDLCQNILAFNYVNLQNADARGKHLSIGEQVNFMKHRASELRSGARHFIGHGHYKGKDDVYAPLPYLRGQVQIQHFDYSDASDNKECIGDGKGKLTWTTSHKRLEDELVFKMDLEIFTSLLSEVERKIFLLRFAGYDVKEIASELRMKTTTVRVYLRDLGQEFKHWFALA